MEVGVGERSRSEERAVVGVPVGIGREGGMDQALVATGEGVGVEEEIGHIGDVGDFPTAEITG